MSCPICHGETDQKYRPFCSRRCADIDMGRWLGGQYAVASNDPDDIEQVIEAMEQRPEKPH
ncbi:DNA gyrase inhibitor YacG [Thalassovita taeanensis]|uniref:DNA gyrase inhibitor YacG n=1 Tax=Thalassovita taeanensis TaxID=657014 RepID=A0A1H9G7X4_9RHOB|nr:DNA gyrase inhibitor YacG [Thalassovita taeanensis]SEQ45848.1 hypothetical protein SAMN04488092_10762 [Thalassovita taeanensis]